MLKDNGFAKQMLAAIFVTFLLIGFVKNGSYRVIGEIFDCLESGQDIQVVENNLSSRLWKKRELIDLNGWTLKAMGARGFYADMGLYVADGQYIVSASDMTSTDYEVEQTLAFKDFLDANGIGLLYVNQPTKYLDDDMFATKFAIKTYSNHNADLFLQRIKNAGVHTLDLRENIRQEGRDIRRMFYRTDHHWTVPAGLWATQMIASAMDDELGHSIDLSLYDIENYEAREWKECWLGEQGRKIAKTYIGLDDYIELKPKFATNLVLERDHVAFEGSFDDFVNESVFDLSKDVYENPSWHYAYDRLDCINNNVATGKILVLGDSYAHVMQPFLSLGVHECDILVLRELDDSFDLHQYILENGYDTVVIAYAQFMIGAHDNPSSANYRMFHFND